MEGHTDILNELYDNVMEELLLVSLQIAPSSADINRHDTDNVYFEKSGCL